MAAILQLRQGSTSTYITQGPNIAEPFFDTGSNILVVGKSATEVIKLTKLDESNLGSFDITGDYSGSNLYLSGDLTASNATLSGDITIGGNIILGDAIQDNITISGQFNSDLIPSQSLQYNLGSQTKKWNHLYASSASIDNIDLVSNLPSGVVSGSQQIVDSLPIGSVSGSQQVIDFLPVNTVSGSDQVLGGTSIVSSSQQVTNFLPTNTISSSQQVVDFLPTNVVSGSGQILGGTNVVSSSIQVTNFLPTETVSGSDQILGGTNIASSSQQVIDFLPTGTVSGSSQFTDGSFILSSSLHPAGFDVYTSEVDNRLNPLEVSTTALNSISHSHDNKVFLDLINQSLRTGSNPSFNDINIAGTASFDSNVTIYGDLTTFGTQSIINSTNLAVADNMIYLNSGSTITNPDLGFAGNYNDGTYAHAGLFRDASDNGVWKFYDGYTPEPEGNIDTTHASFTLANIEVLGVITTAVTSDNYYGTGSSLTFPGTNIVSSSQQVINFLPTNTVSGSDQILGSTNIISSSAQAVLFMPSNIVSSSAQLTASYDVRYLEINGDNVISSSQQVVDFLPTETVSGSDQVLGGTNIVSSSIQVANFLPTGTVSGSSQILNGSNVVSASNQVQELLPPNTLSGSNQITQSFNELYAQSSSLYTLIGNFPTSGSLGTAAFYNVSSSLGDDPDVIPNVKAVFDYINNTIGAADITGVSASLGLSGGGDGGYVSLSLDTASAHFQAGVELYGTNETGVVEIFNANNVLSGSYLGTATTSNLTEGSNLYWTETRFSSSLDDRGVVSSSLGINNPGGATDVTVDINSETLVFTSGSANNDSGIGVWVSNNMGTKQVQIYGLESTTTTKGVASFNGDGFSVTNGVVSLASGIISGSPQLTQDVSISEIIIKNSDGTLTGSNHYADDTNLVIGSSTPTNIGGEQLTINGTGVGLSGILSFTENDVIKSYDYVTADVRIIDTAGGTAVSIKPDNDPTKAWVFDLAGDLVSNGGDYGSGDIYAWRAQFSSSVSASDAYIVNRVNASDVGLESGLTNFIGNIQSTNGVISGSSQVITLLPSGTISGSSQVLDGTNIVSSSQQVINLLPTGTVSGSVVTTLNGTGVLSGSAIDNGFVDLTSTQTIGGTKTFNDIVVNGTGSFAYFVSTESELNVIGQSFIVLNNDTPTERYAGLAVYDSGSAGVTASLQFDGQTNDWFYEYSDDGGVTTDHGAVIFGAAYNTKGAPSYPSNNTIQKGNGEHHILDSNITDDGTTITLGSDSIILGVGEFSSFTEITGSVSIQQGLNVEGNATFSNAQFDDITASTVSATGDIVAYASSDRRLKDKIVPIPFALDKINQIGGYSFVWNTQKQDIYNGKDYGVVAQEIEEILPELVQTRENGYKAVKYDKLVSLLIEGIKELSQEVNELKEKLNRE